MEPIYFRENDSVLSSWCPEIETEKAGNVSCRLTNSREKSLIYRWPLINHARTVDESLEGLGDLCFTHAPPEGSLMYNTHSYVRQLANPAFIILNHFSSISGSLINQFFHLALIHYYEDSDCS